MQIDLSEIDEKEDSRHESREPGSKAMSEKEPQVEKHFRASRSTEKGMQMTV
jgi:hypothetical protein